MRKIGFLNSSFVFLGSLVLFFIVAPLVGMVLNTTPGALLETTKDKEVISSVCLTISTAFGATIVSALAVIPLAYLLARKEFFGKRIILGIINLPVVIPHSAAGIAVLGFVSRDTLIGQAAESLGFSFVGNPVGISVAMAFVSVPFLINAARDGFQAVPERLEKAALNLGAKPLRVFFSISLPLAWRSIVSGLIMMFARGMSEFGAVVIIAYHPMITPVLIYERFGSFGLKHAVPVSVFFIAVCLVFFVLLRLLTKERKHA